MRAGAGCGRPAAAAAGRFPDRARPRHQAAQRRRALRRLARAGDAAVGRRAGRARRTARRAGQLSGRRRSLARRLTDAGLAHPRPPAVAAAPDVTVLIPVRDRQLELDRCLAALGGAYPVLVVDDGSADQAATAAVAARHGATLIRRPVAGGPASARNTGLAAIGTLPPGTGASGTGASGTGASGTGASGTGASTTDAVALLDSDCVPPPDWIAQLAAHLADPLVGAVAPRVVPAAGALSAPHRAGCRPRPAVRGRARRPWTSAAARRG